MSNNVPFQSGTPATPPVQTIVETEDQGGGVHRQVVKVGNTLAITGALTDTQLRATAVPVSGAFWQATQPVSLAAAPALVASTAAIGNVGMAPRAAQLTPAAISFSSSGDNTVVAGVAAQTVKVYRLVLTVAGATVLTFKSGAGTSLSGAMTLNAGGSIMLDFDGEPWFTTAAAAAFVINSTNAVQVSGTVYSLTS